MRKILSNIQWLPLYAVLGYTMGLPGYLKIFEHDRVIGNYTQMFQDTFIHQFPGTSFMMYVIGVMEILVPVLLLVSIVKKEFLVGYAKTWLLAANILTLVTYAVLGFGMRFIENHPGAANLYFYFMLTLIVYLWIQKVEKEETKIK